MFVKYHIRSSEHFLQVSSLSLIFLITLYWTLKLKQYKKSFSSLLLVRCCGLPSTHWISKATALSATVLTPPEYLETFDKRKNFCEISFVFLFLKPFLILLLKFCSDRGVTSLRESQSHPCCENIQRNDEIPFIPSHWAWNHQHTISKHFFTTLRENMEQFKAADDPMIHKISFAQILIGA